jgi:nucleoside-diphosphate-sugar epimerase
MRILLTGANGFIGSHLTRLLTGNNVEVHALVRPGSDMWRISDLRGSPSLHLHACDLGNAAELSRRVTAIRPNLCIHLAWSPTPGRELNALENQDSLVASVALLRFLERAGCRRVLMAGTCVEYDTDNGYLSESSPTRPRTLYAASKLALLTYSQRYAELAGIDFAWLRFFYLHGPHEDRRRLVPSVVLRLLAQEPALVTAGEQVKDYLHVEDVAAAVWAVAQSPLTGVVNIGSGSPVKVRGVVMKIAELLEQTSLVRLGALPYAPHDPMFVCANNNRLVQNTGWRPRYDLDQGLNQTIAWWRAHRRLVNAAA